MDQVNLEPNLELESDHHFASEIGWFYARSFQAKYTVVSY